METLIWLSAYVLGWLAFTVPSARFASHQWPTGAYCHSEGQYGFQHSYRHSCRTSDKAGCWRGDGEPRVGLDNVAQASGAALLWPILWLPVLAWWLATRRPLPLSAEQMARRIEQLEREAGIR